MKKSTLFFYKDRGRYNFIYKDGKERGEYIRQAEECVRQYGNKGFSFRYLRRYIGYVRLQINLL